MHKGWWLLLFLFSMTLATSQVTPKRTLQAAPQNQMQGRDTPIPLDSVSRNPEFKKASIDQYRIVTLSRDTTLVDTSLTIRSDYRHNYLRRDPFGMLPYANEGQTYTLLDYQRRPTTVFPQMGYGAKHVSWLQTDDIRYYSVATPLTDLYFRTVMQQGQSVDAFITANTAPEFNFSVAYKGLRSSGRYINQLSSFGHFRFTASYTAKDKRYVAHSHFVSQDFLNGENGGVRDILDFESEDTRYDNRARLDVFFRDAESFLRGKRVFLDHRFRINKTQGNHDVSVFHRFNYERKFFEFDQPTLTTALPQGGTVQRFGPAYVTSNLKDQTRYNMMHNRGGVSYDNAALGTLGVFADDFRFNYYFGRILINEGEVNTGNLSDGFQTFGAFYIFSRGALKLDAEIFNAIADQNMRSIVVRGRYNLRSDIQISAFIAQESRVPNHQFQLHQSSYIGYNWSNAFKNEKSASFGFGIQSPWVNLSGKFTSVDEHLYFSNDDVTGQQLISTPKQYSGNIGHFRLEADREFRLGKWALDNRVLYQKVEQQDDILNVPDFVLRHTFYFSDHYFKRALFLQTGLTFHYFSGFYADDYNPLIGEYSVQSEKKIGDYPMFDFFVNARIRQTRLFFKLEHFNSSFTGNKFLNSANYPYRDFVFRFGLEWNFFQ